MGRTCTICVHPEKEKIEAAIVSNEKYQNIAEQFHIVSISSITRHKQNCMPAAIQAVKQKQAEQTAHVIEEAAERKTQFVWNLLEEMEWLHEEAHALHKAAKSADDYGATGKALGEARQQMKLFSELLQGNEPGQAEKLEREWIAIREIVFEELEPYPEVRLAIARRLRALKGSHDYESDGQFFEADSSCNAS